VGLDELCSENVVCALQLTHVVCQISINRISTASIFLSLSLISLSLTHTNKATACMCMCSSLSHTQSITLLLLIVPSISIYFSLFLPLSISLPLSPLLFKFVQQLSESRSVTLLPSRSLAQQSISTQQTLPNNSVVKMSTWLGSLHWKSDCESNGGCLKSM